MFIKLLCRLFVPGIDQPEKPASRAACGIFSGYVGVLINIFLFAVKLTIGILAGSIAIAADAGDEAALAVYRESGRKLGQGLSILIDILNPERIVIGSIFARSEHLLRPAMEEVLRRETLAASMDVCRIVPAELGEAIGDLASLAII